MKPYTKNIFDIHIPYYFNKKISFNLFRRYSDKKFQIVFSIWLYRRLIDIVGYEDEWGLYWNNYYTLYSKEII